MEAKVVSKLPLPFDIQEYILVNIMKLYKLRDGKYVRQIDKTKYKFLDYIMRPAINKNSFHYHESIHRDIHEDIFNSNEDTKRFRYKFNIKNVHDSPLRKDSHVDDDIVDVRIEYKNNIYYYEVGIYKLKLKNIEENNFTPEKMRKDIYHKGSLQDTCFWDFLEFSYEMQ
jgi:hypothetical protein